MKPRRQVTSLTLEDMNILLQLALRAEPNHDAKLSWYLRVVVPADRRDAELMYRIEICRQYERDHAEKFVEYRGLGWVNCLVETALESPVRFTGSDITYFA
jgi:hypothetical protein